MCIKNYNLYDFISPGVVAYAECVFPLRLTAFVVTTKYLRHRIIFMPRLRLMFSWSCLRNVNSLVNLYSVHKELYILTFYIESGIFNILNSEIKHLLFEIKKKELTFNCI